MNRAVIQRVWYFQAVNSSMDAPVNNQATVIDMNERARDAWDAFVVAKERAQMTGLFEDGLKAGRAWRTFLNLFAATDDQMSVAPSIIEFPHQGNR